MLLLDLIQSWFVLAEVLKCLNLLVEMGFAKKTITRKRDISDLLCDALRQVCRKSGQKYSTIISRRKQKRDMVANISQATA